jgi:hypothetical protein
MKNTLARSLVAAVFAAVSLLSLVSCSSYKVTDVWVAPDVSKLHFKKVLAIAAIQEDGLRRVVEDALVSSMPGVMAIPSYQFLPAADMKDVAKVTAELKAAQFDGVVVIRLIDRRQETNVTTTMDYPYAGAYGVPYGAYGGYGYPSAYRSFGGYYGGYAGPYGYGYGGSTTTTVTTDNIATVEANIYEFPGEKLVWSGVTETTSPGNIEGLVGEVVAAVRNELVKMKLIDTPAK